MKTLVIYSSKTGFVKKYAEWIAEELRADLFPADRAHKSIFRSYDTIIYGGGFDLTKLGFFDKFLMKLLKMKIMSKKKKGIPLDGDEVGMLNAMEKPVDFTKKENIKELVDHALKV